MEWRSSAPSVELLVVYVGSARPLGCGIRREADPLADPDVVEAAAADVIGDEEPVHPAVVANEAEAVLRLKAQCPDAHIVLNLRLETANIANTQGKKGIGALEVVAYGTAVRYAG